MIAARRGNTVVWLAVGLGLVAALHALRWFMGSGHPGRPGSLPAGSVAQLRGSLMETLTVLALPSPAARIERGSTNARN
jgi:hypothetical protein